jgi:hypothetical protein
VIGMGGMKVLNTQDQHWGIGTVSVWIGTLVRRELALKSLKRSAL